MIAFHNIWNLKFGDILQFDDRKKETETREHQS